MFYPLTQSIIKKYNKLYLSDILALQKSSDKEDLVYQSIEFLDQFISEIDYSTLLYIVRQYILGNLHAITYAMGPMHDDHKESFPVLEQLALTGILTSDGQVGCIESKMRSYLTFEFPIELYDTDRAIQLLIKLYERGMNVGAEIVQFDQDENDYSELNDYEYDWIPIRRIHLFKSENAEIYDLDADTLHTDLTGEDYLVTEPATWCVLERLRMYYFINNIKFPTDYRVKVNIFSQKWDELQADKILLELINEMQAK